MEYVINMTRTLDEVEREISKQAQRLLDDKGLSIYGDVIYYTKDFPVLEEMYASALASFESRTFDVVTPEENKLVFELPDFDESMSSSVTHEIDQYLANMVVSTWMQAKGQGVADIYAGKATASMEKAVTLLKSRKPPKR